MQSAKSNSGIIAYCILFLRYVAKFRKIEERFLNMSIQIILLEIHRNIKNADAITKLIQEGGIDLESLDHQLEFQLKIKQHLKHKNTQEMMNYINHYRSKSSRIN